jgi:hypothetical protein
LETVTEAWTHRTGDRTGALRLRLSVIGNLVVRCLRLFLSFLHLSIISRWLLSLDWRRRLRELLHR